MALQMEHAARSDRLVGGVVDLWLASGGVEMESSQPVMEFFLN